MILYYKYGPDMRDCVKVIQSTSSRGNIGLRFLQINMFHEDFSRNSVEIYDGGDVDPARLLVQVQANTSGEDVGQLYLSSGNTLSVHLHASVSQRTYGFIAEVVQVPFTGLTYPGILLVVVGVVSVAWSVLLVSCMYPYQLPSSLLRAQLAPLVSGLDQ
jgi:hypothetical protein